MYIKSAYGRPPKKKCYLGYLGYLVDLGGPPDLPEDSIPFTCAFSVLLYAHAIHSKPRGTQHKPEKKILPNQRTVSSFCCIFLFSREAIIVQ